MQSIKKMTTMHLIGYLVHSMNNEMFIEVKTGVDIRHISKFKHWSRSRWPVADYAKYGTFPTQYITMIFPRHLEKDIMMRILTGEFTIDNIKRRFENVHIDC